MMAGNVTVPMIDGGAYECSVVGIGPKNKHLLSLIIHLNYVRLGYCAALPFQADAVQLLSSNGEVLAELRVAGLQDRDLWDWLLWAAPEGWNSLSIVNRSPSLVKGQPPEEFVYERFRAALLDDNPSCSCLGVTRSIFFRELVTAAKAEFLRTFAASQRGAR